jgi:hypothetical protein
MMYQNPICSIIDQNAVRMQLQTQNQRRQVEQYRNQQLKKTGDCARKLEGFLRSMDEVDPQYQQLAFEQCCMVAGKYTHDKGGM